MTVTGEIHVAYGMNRAYYNDLMHEKQPYKRKIAECYE